MDRIRFMDIMETMFDIACVAGIVYLASNGKDGWGWLIFLLLMKKG
jgi:hypothetical protein